MKSKSQKIKKGLWSFNGVFDLVDVSQENSNNRKVHIFKLVLTLIAIRLLISVFLINF